jgi:hypothetical protein
MILFLDYDGVLHPDAVFLERGRPVLRVEDGLFMWAELRVNALASYPRVRIVLSTSRVRELRFSRARDFLPDALRSRVIGATWWDQATRYQQIRRYVDRTRLPNWIAVDDNPEGWGDTDQDHLIRTDSEHGLSDPDVLACLSDLPRRSK